ncbi:hypothetical protein AABB24_020373 [Solanum stoloniferum]|uniref:ATP-dependent DNA helicase n=1 Tax=Solanum stoloniferum TaxID=62892 RepID=A0ABD2T811_9SOLN
MPSCEYCGAKRFQYESPGFCCSNGTVKLASHEMPTELLNLLLGDTAECKHFRTYIRMYNNMFAFTSLGVKYDKELAKRYHGIYTFRVQGQMYHFIDNVLPSNQQPRNLQLYIYDDDTEMLNRMASSSIADQSVVQKLMNILKINPYCIFLKSLMQVPKVPNLYIALNCDSALNQQVYNLPTVSEVAAIWLDQQPNNSSSTPHIQIYPCSNTNQLVNYYYGCYDPLQYPLLFPFGQNGWHCGIKRVEQICKKKFRSQCENEQLPSLSNMCSIEGLLDIEAKVLQKGKRKRDDISCREYYCYKFQMRHNEINGVLHSGRLFQQYSVDEFIKIETQRLDFVSCNQDLFRTDPLQGLIDFHRHGDRDASKVGKQTFLPVSFTGGPRDMRQRYMDAITLVQHFGKPDIFLTMTCNPSWPEIEEYLLSTDEAQNRPDLICRVFKAKVEELKTDILKKNIFGKVVAFMYTIEFQKRGLPHAHFLLILNDDFKLITPESYDQVVSAELPDINESPYLHKLVKKHMMHGPCGYLNPTNSCMKKKGICKFRYRKNFADKTTKGKNSYAVYRRRNTGEHVEVRKQLLDNSWVVPFNPYLLCKFNCHINVEVCSDIKVVKYIYKYICKGHDKISFSIREDDTNVEIDEIKEYQSARWVSAPEAVWRLFAFPISEMSPSVYHLQLHLENQQFVSFKTADNIDKIMNNPMIRKTMLTEYFLMNRTNEYAKQLNLLYKEFPQYFVWSKSYKIWTRRQRGHVIGRLVTCHPTEGERYYLRLLLMNVRSPESYQDLRKIDGKYYDTFRESAEKRGLLHHNNNLVDCMTEAVCYQMPYSLRHLFATILVYCNPDNPKELWEQFEESMSEDFNKLPNMDPKKKRHSVLNHINDVLHTMGHDVNEYRLISENVVSSRVESEAKDVNFERNIVVTKEDLLLYKKLNTEQKKAYDIILQRVLTNESGAFFIDGPGGSGKTFLYRALLATVRSKGFIALATTTSGVAASILPGGRTAHSRFKIPINIDEQFSCNISLVSLSSTC